MRVTDIANRAGVGAHTVRYYVRAGLITPARDPSNNYKRFGEPDVARLRFIKAVQGLGFSLAEVQDMLSLVDKGECPCSSLHERLADKLLEAREQMHALGQRIEVMQSVYDGWSRTSPERQALGELCRELESRAAKNAASATQVKHSQQAPRTLAPLRSASGSKAGKGRGRQSTSGNSARQSAHDSTSLALSLLEKRWQARGLA
jgi:DNA-binding transcriptional MerR regulator